MSTLVEAIWYQPEQIADDGSTIVQECVVVQMTGGPKRYMRLWTRDLSMEWGWVVHDSAIKLWEFG